MGSPTSLREQVHAAVERLTEAELTAALELLASLHDAEEGWRDWQTLAAEQFGLLYEGEPEIYTLDDAIPRNGS